MQEAAFVNCAWGEKGRTLLIEACSKRNVDNVDCMIFLLIRFNADVNNRDDRGITALMEASRNGYNKIVEALLRAGANVNAKTHTGWTALMQAVMFAHPKTAYICSKKLQILTLLII